MKEVEGKMKLVGIKAIDNDMSMGTLRKLNITSESMYVSLPEDMKIIRKERADAIMALDEKKIRLMYRDMNFTEAELKSAVDRVKDVQKAIKDKKITVVADEDFKNYKFDDLRSRGKQFGKGAPRNNLFDIVSDMQTGVKTWQPAKEEKQIRYNAAQSIEKQYRREGVIHASDLSAQLETLKSIQDSFVRTDVKLHIDSGTFKLMKTTLADCIGTIREMQEKYKGQAELSAQDAEKLERAYRQLRKASGGYAAGHGNPSSPMGQARQNGALEMKDMWPPRLEPPKPMVNEINLEEMMNRNGINIQENKGSRRNANEKQANASKKNLQDDDDFVIEGENDHKDDEFADDDDDFVIEGYEAKKDLKQPSQKNSSQRVM